MGLPLSAVAEPVDMHREPLKTLPGVTRVRDITWQVFRDDFLSPGVPVVVEDGARTWPALERWTLESFQELFGELQTERRLPSNIMHTATPCHPGRRRRFPETTAMKVLTP